MPLVTRPLEYYYRIEDRGYVSPCWIWRGGTISNKYNLYGYYGSGSKSKKKLAHRCTYIQHRGFIPKGMELDHLCCVTLCVNPFHLEMVTHKENIRRVTRRWLDRTRRKDGIA